MKKTMLCLVGVAMALVVSSPLSVFAADFPGRAKYPSVKTISTDELSAAAKAGSAVLVDVRSPVEYDVIHPVNALHISVSDAKFESAIKDLAAKNASKTIAVYCNGVTCYKAYEAAERATAAGVASVVAYDAGVPDWAAKFPDKTLLLGKRMSESKKAMISEAAHTERVMSFDAFKKAAAADNAMVIDVRDNVQKSGALPGLEKAISIPLDKFIPNFVKTKANQDKRLLIFDQVGKQVVWLEYYLIENGYKDYTFLKGGATAVLSSQHYK